MFLFIYFLILFSTTIYAQVYYVMNYNATGDGKTNDTSAVRAALAADFLPPGSGLLSARPGFLPPPVHVFVVMNKFQNRQLHTRLSRNR
jgi:hypothetical protein